jgi:membrane-associated PAP2 superfamily phosphatase
MKQAIRKNLPWGLPILLMGLVTPLTPILDLQIESYFFEHSHFSQNSFYNFIFDYGSFPGEIVGILSFIILILSFISKKWAHWRSSVLVMVLTILIGAGFIVHAVLKDHWGRPRPRQTIEFGGKQVYRPYYSPNFFHQPEPSKSFPCGHASMGFCFFALVMLGKRFGHRPLAITGWGTSLIFGGILSLARMAQGGHFFSDVLMTALIMWLTAYACDRCVHSFRLLNPAYRAPTM